MSNGETSNLITEYRAELNNISQKLKRLESSLDSSLLYRQINGLKSIKKDLKYSISLMEKHQQ